MDPTPLPSPSAEIVLPVDPSRVTPGIYGFLTLIFLIIVVVVLYLSMRKQLSKINFDEDSVPAGVRPLPPYATKAERRKTAQRIEAEHAAKASARQARKTGAADTDHSGDPPAGTSSDGPAGADAADNS